MLEAADWRGEHSSAQRDTPLERGIALNPLDASRYILDYRRTQCFLAATEHAIRSRRDARPGALSASHDMSWPICTFPGPNAVTVDPSLGALRRDGDAERLLRNVRISHAAGAVMGEVRAALRRVQSLD